MSDDYKVGYRKPPKQHRFKKGQSGNPKGAPKKQPAAPRSNSLASILKRVGEKTVSVGGENHTYLELEILAMQTKAAKGDVAASKHLSKLRTEAGLLKPDERRGGVLVVPGISKDVDTWEREASASQAKFRGEDPEGLEALQRSAEFAFKRRDGETKE